MTANMDISFIVRTMKTTGVLGLVVLAFGWMYFEIFDVLAVFSGVIWSVVNLYFLSLLIVNTIKPDKIKVLQVVGLALIKLPLLYLAAYFLIKNPDFKVVPLVIGFSSIFVVILLKVLSRAIFGLDNNKPLIGTNRQETN